MIVFKMILLCLKILSTQTLEIKLCLLDVSDLLYWLYYFMHFETVSFMTLHDVYKFQQLIWIFQFFLNLVKRKLSNTLTRKFINDQLRKWRTTSHACLYVKTRMISYEVNFHKTCTSILLKMFQRWCYSIK